MQTHRSRPRLHISLARAFALILLAFALMGMIWALTGPGDSGTFGNCISNTDGFNPHAIKNLPICKP